MGLNFEAKTVNKSTIGAVKSAKADEIVMFVWNAVNKEVAAIVEKRLPKNNGFICEKETFSFLIPMKGTMDNTKNDAVRSPQNIKVKEFILLSAKPAKRLEKAWNNCWKIMSNVANFRYDLNDTLSSIDTRTEPKTMITIGR